jgi:DNA-binding NarL/FixJ family response regulator
MSLRPFLGDTIDRFQPLFRAWFLSSGIDKSVAIASESRLLLSTLYGSFQRRDVVSFVGTSGRLFLEHLKSQKVGLLLVTEGLDDMSGDSLIRQALVLQPDLRSVLLIEPYVQAREPLRVYESDVVVASSDMLKPDFALRAGVLAALGGARYRSPSIQAYSVGQGIELSATERKLLEFYAAGLTLDEMSERLPYTKNTVKTYSRNLMQKLGVGNRQKAISAAIALGLTGLLRNDGPGRQR